MRLDLEYRENELKEDGLGYPGTTHYNVAAASGMWEGQLSNRLTMTLARRVDHLDLGRDTPINQPKVFTSADFDRSFTEWSFNGALRLKLDEASAPRRRPRRPIAVAHQFRAAPGVYDTQPLAGAGDSGG